LPATNNCWRFDTKEIPERYHDFHLHCPGGKEQIWKLYKTSDKIFLFSAKNLLLFLNNFYKFYVQNEWEKVRQKIPPELGLYGTIFISIAANINSCSWHTDPSDLQFVIIIYFGK
jgi:hypothetical protein